MRRVHTEVSVPRYLLHSLPLSLPLPCKWEFDFALHWNPFLEMNEVSMPSPGGPRWFLREINGDGRDVSACKQTVTRRLPMPLGSLCLIVAVMLHFKVINIPWWSYSGMFKMHSSLYWDQCMAAGQCQHCVRANWDRTVMVLCAVGGLHISNVFMY